MSNYKFLVKKFTKELQISTPAVDVHEKAKRTNTNQMRKIYHAIAFVSVMMKIYRLLTCCVAGNVFMHHVLLSIFYHIQDVHIAGWK